MNRLADIRDYLNSKCKPKVIDKNLQRDLQHGWMLQYLVEIESLCWHRWDYWLQCQVARSLPEAPIPKICFSSDRRASNHLESALDMIPEHGGGWQGWSSFTNLDYFLDWMLYGFGYSGQPELPNEPSNGASMRLYQYLNLAWLIAYPSDYLGEIMSNNHHGRSLGFFPTPQQVVEMMVAMLMPEDVDTRTQSVCDPCIGTGRMLLSASNHSMVLYGMDISPTAIKASLVNGYLYAPWMVKPLLFLDTDQAPEHSAQIAESMREAAIARPDVQEYLANTEHDTDQQWKFEPIKKLKKFNPIARKETEVLQGVLF